MRREGRSGLAILAFGTLLEPAQKIAERLDATVVNMRFVKPLDEELVIASRRAPPRASSPSRRMPSSAARAPRSASCWPPKGCSMPLLQLGIPDRFIEHGSRDSCLVAAGLDTAGPGRRSIERWWASADAGTRTYPIRAAAA